MSVPGMPFVRRLGNVVKDGIPQALHCRTGYEWHSDGRHSVTMLACGEAPSAGGETLFASSRELFDALPPQEQLRAQRAIAVYSSQYVGGGPSAFDCERGLRTSADGTRLLCGVTSRGRSWRPWASKTPLVSDSGISAIDTRHFSHFDNIKELLDMGNLPARVSDVLSHDMSSSDEENANENWLDYGESSDQLVKLASNRAVLAEASRELLSAWLHEGLQPLELAELDTTTMLPGAGQSTTFCSRRVYSHKWQKGDVMVWDNDKVIHTATPSSLIVGQRLMWQIVLKRSEDHV